MGVLIGIMLALWANGYLSASRSKHLSASRLKRTPANPRDIEALANILFVIAVLVFGTLAVLYPFAIIAWLVFELAGM